MNSINSTRNPEKAAGNSLYIQPELFNYWSARQKAYTGKLKKAQTEPIESSTPLYLDLFDPLFGLNKEQISLLQAPETYIAVNGPAGTGKSVMLTTLAAYWIKQHKFKPVDILLLTGIENELPGLRLNLENMVGMQSRDVEITTLEPLCYKILCFGGKQGIKLYNRTERKRFLSLIFPFLSSLELEQVSAFIENKNTDKLRNQKEISDLAESYHSSLEKMGACDICALVSQAYKLLTANPGVLSRFKQQFQAILIDDFQNINQAEYKIAALLMNDDLLEEETQKKRKVIVFNDHFQAIEHQPAGGNPLYYKFLAELAEREIIFHRNYRSQRNIVIPANRLLKKIHKKSKQRITSALKKGLETEIYRFDAKDTEMEFISHMIIGLTGNANTYKPGDIGLIVKDPEMRLRIAQNLCESGLPCTVYTEETVHQQQPLAQIIALLNFMLNQKDIVSLADILINVLTGFTFGDVQGIFLAGNRKEETLAMLIGRLYAAHQLTDSQYSQVTGLLAFIKSLKNQVFKESLQAGLAAIFRNWPGLAAQADNAMHTLLQDRAARYAQDVTGFLKSFYFTFTAQTQSQVQILPPAAARGLEFKILFIPGMEEGSWPCYTHDLLQEYRLFYLSLTRAREQLILTAAASDKNRKLALSSFITDLGLPVRLDGNVSAHAAAAQEPLFQVKVIQAQIEF